jgi:CheY-like chemotaxis protein
MKEMNSKTVLIVEDDEGIRETLSEILMEQGFEVEVASNGKEALDLLTSSQNTPGVILLDIMMPIMDGYQFRELQLGYSRLANVPTVAISADGHLNEKSKKLGVAHYLKKPIDLEKLLDLVNKFCG